MYGRMSRARDWTKNCTGNSSELRKFWNCDMVACCSSADFSARFMEEAIRSARRLPSLRMTTPPRTSFIGTKSCVACALTLLGIKRLRVGRERLLFYIKRPGKVLKLALAQSWHYESRRIWHAC